MTDNNIHGHSDNTASSSCPYIDASNSCKSSTLLDTSKAVGSISLSEDTAILKHVSDHQNRRPSIYPDHHPPSQAQIDIVRYTWERVIETHLPTDRPNVSPSHAFGLAFYDALFQIDPALKPLFTNIVQQAKALAGMISYIVRSPEVIDPRPPTPSVTNESSTKKRARTIREINANKRKQSNASSFPELILQTASSKNSGKTNDTAAKDDEYLLLCKLRELGARHYLYGARTEHFALIGSALLIALEVRLGKEYIPEVAEAWMRAHAFTVYHMKTGLQLQIAWEEHEKRGSSSLRLNHVSINSKNAKTNCSIQ
ncbi:uncharacterized protein B0P05DRAFT_561820 [Gilbertella persicaria]|uniref:uncharacterized protein n=1 Tax=Gilbertella persicaria TaxID=101096 RepID=UPI00221FB7DE|nr:uncharacterized protein B0P05DRAFT_561820 [Gilbertella persicaria]KAI8053160.1 hypothetical protein B0P05DRAFT_561820 [Gilbertella persicaria]